MSQKVVIVGSGISSLTTAIFLLEKNFDVTVLESHTKPGGYMHCFERGGYRFDTGAHYVGAMGPGEPFRVLLERLGVFDESDFIKLDASGFDEIHFPEKSYSLPAGYPEIVHQLCEQFPQERIGIEGYFAAVRDAASHFVTYNFKAKTEAEMPLWLLETPLQTVVRKYVNDRQLQALLFAYCGLHGVWPQDVGFGFHSVVTDSLLRGPYAFRKGGDNLANRFVKRIEQLGGRVKLRTRVERLICEDRSVRRVVTKTGEEFPADTVVTGTHPQNILDWVEDVSHFSPAFVKRLTDMQETEGMFGIYALAKGQSFNPLRNYYFFASSDPDHLFDFGSPEQTPSVAFLTSSDREHKLGPQPVNVHLAFGYDWLKPYQESSFGRRPQAYHELKNRYLENCLSWLRSRHRGFDQLEVLATSTPLTNRHYNRSRLGSTYGIYHSIANTGIRALQPRTKILNLLLTGQSVLFPGLLGAASSGLRTAGHLIGTKPILRELEERLECAF